MSYVADYLGPEGFGAYEVDWAGPEPTFTRVHSTPDVLLAPGFVDIHFHGAFGIDFMESPPTELHVLCERLRSCGYEGVLATSVTAAFEDVKNMVENLPDDPLLLGFHLEGPFISTKFPGAQPFGAIVAPSPVASEWDEILDHPNLRLVTLAPEVPFALELTNRLTNRGVRVSMGHTNATYDEARYCFEFGARHATHTFNAMRPFHHRESGVVGYVLGNDSVFCELIYDRHHVSKDAAALLFKCKGPDKVVAVSDSSKATGLSSGQRFDMWWQPVETLLGKVVLEGTETLAGSSITLLDAFQNLCEDFGDEAAIRTCCLNPRRALGITAMPSVYCEFDRKRNLVGIRRAAPNA